jgi:hypothetical protein
MQTGPGGVYGKWNISVVTATQILNKCQPSPGGNRNIFEVMTSTLPKGTIVSVASLLAASSIKDIFIGATNSGISYHLREIYSICRCCGNVATYKWKVHNGNIEIISFVVKLYS